MLQNGYQPIALMGPTYQGRADSVDSERCINMYPEASGSPNAKVPGVLLPTPGYTTFSASVGLAGGVRCLFASSLGRVFGCTADAVYEVLSTGERVTIGTIASQSGRVRMADIGLELIVADGGSGKGYTYGFSSLVFAPISDVAYPGGDTIEFLDQMFFQARPGTQEIYNSGLRDGMTWNGLTFATAEGFPDDVIGILVNNREIWAFGTRSSEVFADSGDPMQPLQRITGAVTEIGLSAKDSVQKLGGAVYWLGADQSGGLSVWRSQGLIPQQISNPAIAYLIARDIDPTAATSWVYSEEGHQFYGLNLSDTTLVFDVSTGLWHERRSWDASTGTWSRHVAEHIVYAFGKVIAGSYAADRIIHLSLDTYADDGATLRRERRFPPNDAIRLRAIHNWIDVEMEYGRTPLLSGLGSDPKIVLSYSSDGGKTWGHETMHRIGVQGQYRMRVRRSRLSTARDCRYMWACTDPVPVVLVAAYLSVKVLGP